MKISILTLFPEVFSAYFASSVPGRALEKGLFELELVNIRDYSTDKHHRVDDSPFGGSAGMLMGPQPLFDCIEDVKRRHEPGTPVIYLSPCGRVWNNVRARQLASSGTGLILLCGHYEAIAAENATTAAGSAVKGAAYREGAVMAERSGERAVIC